MEHRFHRFPTATAAAGALAAAVAERLGKTLATGAEAALAVPGGRTPGRFLETLFAKPLDWARVVIVPTDERWLPAAAPGSNEGMIAARRAGTPAAAARLLGLVTDHPTADEGCGTVAARLAAIGGPFAAVVLGMGEDGHVASLFPGQSVERWITDAPDGAPCLAAQAPVPPHDRLSLAPGRLLATGFLAVLASGQEKGKVLERACNDETCGLPVSVILRNAAVPPEIFWSEE